jgi:hypothetical protein
VHVTLLTPVAALVTLAAVPALVAALRADRRARAVRERLFLSEPGGRSLATTLGAIAAIGALVGLAAAQPVFERSRSHDVRADAQVLIVFDTSRSMAASGSPGSPTRIERARTFAHSLRAQLNDVPMGLTSLTDRVLPYLLPSGNAEVVDATIDKSVAVENPPPLRELATRATQFGALARVPTTNFFSRSATKRLLVVLSDGESQPFSIAGLATALRASDESLPVFVHFWRPNEQVYTKGTAEPEYDADPQSGATMANLAVATRGLAADEAQLDRVVRTAKAFLGSGRTVAGGSERSSFALAPFSLLVALAPLAVLLRRRVF